MSLISGSPILLQTYRRKIRITGGRRLSLLSRPGSAGPLRFAGALLKLYLDREWSDPLHSFILRKSKIGVSIRHLHRYQQLPLTPNLALTVLNWTAPSKSADRSVPVPSAPHLRHLQKSQRIEIRTQKREIHHLEQLVDAIVTKKRRVEHNSEYLIVSSPSTHMPEVKRIVQRVTWSINDPARVAPAAEQLVERKGPERRTGNDMYRAPEAPLDINRLTDQIIQTIDRRIIAQRERAGRV